MRSSPRLGAVALTAVLVLAGCAASETPRPAATLPAGVTVELVQLRADVAPRQAQVKVTNDSDGEITIGAVRVTDPRFDGDAMRVVENRTSTVPPRGSVNVRVQLPPVDCDTTDEGDPEVVLELPGDDGSTEVTASAQDPLGFLAPLHARECLRDRLTAAATLAFTGFTPSEPDAPALLELTITPTGGEATVVAVQRTNLIDFRAATIDGAFPLDLGLGQTNDPVVVELPIVPFRCDPHAVQEDKRGTIFDVRVVVDDDAGEIELFVGEEMRGRILSWVASWCGFGG